VVLAVVGLVEILILFSTTMEVVPLTLLQLEGRIDLLHLRAPETFIPLL
jgi:hypothetical protein